MPHPGVALQRLPRGTTATARTRAISICTQKSTQKSYALPGAALQNGDLSGWYAGMSGQMPFEDVSVGEGVCEYAATRHALLLARTAAIDRSSHAHPAEKHRRQTFCR